MAESFLQSLMGGYQLGSQIKQDRNQSKLAQLASQAYSAPQNERQGILAQAVGVDPKAGMALGDSLQGVDDQRTKTLVQAARYLTAAPESARPGIYQQMKGSLSQFGMQLPEQYDDTVAQTAQALVQAYGGIGDSSELKTFNAMTQGLGPDEVAKARQIALGLQPRAVTGAIKFDTFQGADGRPRPQRNNPTTGGIEIFYDEAGQWVPLGQAQGQQSAAPAQQRAPGEVPFSIDPSLPPQVQAQIRANPDAGSAQGITSLQTSFGGQPQQGGALPPPLDYQNGGQRVPGLGVGRSPEEQAAATTAAQEAAKLRFLPAELGLRAGAAVHQAGAIAGNNAQIARDTASDKVAAQRATTLQMYDTAMKGLREGLAGTETGPVVGRIPAFTSGQQIAEGAVAAMAPILKQLFRSAGEGTFTDRDQALLLEMVPKRTDTEAARQAKMENIDAIVRAKLGQGAEPKSAAPETGNVDDLLGKYGIR